MKRFGGVEGIITCVILLMSMSVGYAQGYEIESIIPVGVSEQKEIAKTPFDTPIQEFFQDLKLLVSNGDNWAAIRKLNTYIFYETNRTKEALALAYYMRSLVYAEESVYDCAKADLKRAKNLMPGIEVLYHRILK